MYVRVESSNSIFKYRWHLSSTNWVETLYTRLIWMTIHVKLCDVILIPTFITYFIRKQTVRLIFFFFYVTYVKQYVKQINWYGVINKYAQKESNPQLTITPLHQNSPPSHKLFSLNEFLKYLLSIINLEANKNF